MKCEWKECNLGDLVTFQRGYDLPKTKMKKGKYPVVGSNGIIGYHNDYTTENPSITIGRSGNVGNPTIIYSRTWAHNTTLYIKEYKNCCPVFIYYFLKTLNLSNYAGGSAVPTLNRNHIHSLQVKVPLLYDVQAKIGSFLKLLDDKIELNNAINHNLEAQASELFDAWFISFVRSDGKMPADWHKGTLGDIAAITSGKRPPMKQAVASVDATIPLVGAASIMGFTNAILYNEPILVTGRVGTHGVVQRFQSPCWTSDNTLVIKSDFYEYTFQVLQRVDYVNMNRGSTQPLITQTDLKNVSIVIPTEEVLLEYEKIAGSLMVMYESNRKENERLATLRDTLLPKLMSGEIDVSEVEI